MALLRPDGQRTDRAWAQQQVSDALGELTGEAWSTDRHLLRMHQARHRHVSQGMLARKRLGWNCRALTHGKRRGACPYQLLGLSLPTGDWWELLQMEPEVLAQTLSIQEVMV